MHRIKMNLIVLFLFFGALAECAEIAIVSIASGEKYRESVSLGLKNKEEYCARHGYDFICGDKTLDASRGITWSKILLIQEVMKNKDVKWIFWSDADALIMNTALLIEDLIDENYNLIINFDHNGFNSGHFLIRNCEWSRRFLEEAYTHDEFVNDTEWEQGAMLTTLQSDLKYSSATKIVPQRLMNSFPAVIGSLLQVTYRPGDFVLHFAGVRDVHILKSLFEYYYPLASDQIDSLTYDQFLSIHGVTEMPKYPDDFKWSIEAQNKKKLNWSTKEQNEQYSKELRKHPEIQTIAQIGLSNGELAEVFFTSCPNLIQSVAYVEYKRYDPFCRAACDYLSRKYRSKWKEASESPEEITPTKSPFDLIHIQPRTLTALIQAKQLAKKDTLLWINDYNIPLNHQIVSEAVEQGVIEILDIHSSGEERNFRSWVEAHYILQP